MSGKKILHLTLKKKWFDLIANGEKTEEYRTYNSYWMSRLVAKDKESFRVFDEVHFRNGYSKKCPFMRVEFKYLDLGNRELEDKNQLVFVIKLGKVLEVRAREKSEAISEV